jgi:hypothetical protein
MFDQTQLVFAKAPSRVRSGLRLLLICGFVGVVSALTACGGGGGHSSSTDENDSESAEQKYPKVPTPKVTLLPSAGVSPERDYPFLAADYSLENFGFVEEEYLIEGTANTYDLPGFSMGDLEAKGTANVVTKDNLYRTRMMVYRPTDPAKFNGTVIVEWVNATNTWDTPIHWFEQKNMVFRKGYGFVWISNQDQTVSGANGLKTWSPARYGSLDVTHGGKVSDEGLSWDIFSQTAKAVRAAPAIMGGMKIKKVIGVGESQSAVRAGAYFNAIHPLTGDIFDGALITNAGPAMRTDLSIPIIKILTETEVTSPATNNTMILQADTEKFKTWFVTGSTHSNLTSLLPRTVQYVRDMNGRMINDGCSISQNSRLPLSHIYNAGIVRLEEYIDSGKPIPSSPAMQITASPTDPSVARDSYGIALGGIRHPEVAVPVAVNSGVNTGTACGPLGGAHIPFTKTQLDSLYPSHSAYVDQVTGAANQAVTDGFMLIEDAQDVIANAQASIWGRQLNCDGDGTTNFCADQWLFPQKPSILNLRWHIYLYYLPNRATLLAPVDQAAIAIASAYNVSDTATRKMYFSQAIALLQQYADLIQAEGSAGNLSSEATTYLMGQASRLVIELQKL